MQRDCCAERQRLLQPMPGQHLQQASALQHGKELPWGEQAQGWMLPADRGLDTGQDAVDAHLGLVADLPLLARQRQLLRRQTRQFEDLRGRSGDRGGARAIAVLAHQSMQHRTAGRLRYAAEQAQSQLRDEFADGVEQGLVGVAEHDQRIGQAPFGQMADHRQAIRAIHVQIADRHVHRPAALQHLHSSWHRLRRQHVEHAIGVEHLVQGHELKRVVFEDQDLERVHGMSLRDGTKRRL